jgi:putative endonuclease
VKTGLQWYVYIITNKKSGVLYIGVTNDLVRRMCEHKEKLVPGFSSRYNLTRLVCYEAFGDPYNAIIREKQLKGWLRSKKVELIERENREWIDLAASWYE